jgi:1,4-dihydroxy-2-naphthoate octaprenyltransferase
MPFALGAVLAWKAERVFRPAVFLWGAAGVVAVMLATYLAGELHDRKEDALAAVSGRTRFSGGSGVLVAGLVPEKSVRTAVLASLAAAAAVGLVLVFGYGAGPLTIPLGALGLVCGYFYSTPPFRWVSRGIGELMIGFCYGWLPVAVSYYLMTGRIAPEVTWTSVPVGLTIFNVILINEFPDFEADRAAGKKNLTVRLGPARAARLYAAFALLALLSFIYILLRLGFHTSSLIAAAPVALIGLAAIRAVLASGWKERVRLERICGLTLLFNLSVSAALILMIWIFRA